jgi:putative addiction module CopG family antidote
VPTRNVVLTDYQADLVERLVSSGRYQSASEVLREGLRLVVTSGPKTVVIERFENRVPQPSAAASTSGGIVGIDCRADGDRRI